VEVAHAGRPHAELQRRKLILKAKVEKNTSDFSFKRLVRGGFNMGLIGSTCTALPSAPPPAAIAPSTRLQKQYTPIISRGRSRYRGAYTRPLFGLT